MRPFIRQVMGVEGEAGIVTLDIIHKYEGGIALKPLGHINWHSRTPMEGATYQPQCNYLGGDCYGFREDVELSEDFVRILKPGEIICPEEVLTEINKIFEYITELYEKEFKVKQ